MTQWLTRFLARNTPSCKEVTRLISESMEKKPSFRPRVAIRLHFLICKWCARYQKQLLLIRNILRRDPEKFGANAPGALSPEARERMKRALDQNKTNPPSR